ncbi:uncharacterized protein [Lolium perenne]|uniref:uncharacterized protein n=1 Tax=Lolium perenne TaxID=4522 RepID=UPI003A992DFB
MRMSMRATPRKSSSIDIDLDWPPARAPAPCLDFDFGQNYVAADVRGPHRSVDHVEKLAEANERADALARKLEQSEAARKKADLAASKAKAEADEAKAKAAGVEELQKKLEDATAALDEHKAAQASREEGILKRLKTQSRRTFTQTNQDFDLTNPVNDPVLDALSYLELHGSEIREGVSNASAVLSALFPYFFPKKEEPATFLNLAKMFNTPEDLGLKMRQENMKVAVENTVALVADSRQTIDWMKVGDTEQIEQSRMSDQKPRNIPRGIKKWTIT